ncbi:Alpha/Beta hydrolase protein [Trichoderma camerunense]
MLKLSALFALGLSIGQTAASPCQALPVIDLGYVHQQATTYNRTTDIYTFSNIRYAAAPEGNLRFRAPQAPPTNRTSIQDGSGVRMCPQGYPNWLVSAFTPIGEFASGEVPFSINAWEESFNETFKTINFNTATSEDCLFLDVYVPGKVLQQSKLKNAPVLVYIHGGGFVLGSKLGTSGESLPTGLLEQSIKENGSGMIVVSINYRLGAFGWLSGPEVEKDGVLNAGLLDQRLALDWVQKNIGLFGGNAKHVTAIGESGGAAAIMLHMAAYGGKAGSTPFQQAILQSPAIMPTFSVPSSAYDQLASALNVTCIEDLRKLDSQTLISVNAQQVAHAPLNTFGYTAVKDGSLVPGAILQNTPFDKDVKVLVAHNSFEGGIFFDPSVKTEEDFATWLGNSITGLSSSATETLTETIYPPIFDGSYGYTDQDTRQMALWGEGYIESNLLLAGQFAQGQTYAYEFSVVPGAHTQDLSYTFNDPTSPPASLSAQQSLQEAVVGFSIHGVPTFSSSQKWPVFGANGALVNISASTPAISQSRVNATRCHWWKNQKF